MNVILEFAEGRLQGKEYLEKQNDHVSFTTMWYHTIVDLKSQWETIVDQKGRDR